MEFYDERNSIYTICRNLGGLVFLIPPLVGGVTASQVRAAARMVGNGMRVAGPWGFAAGVGITIGIEVYERYVM